MKTIILTSLITVLLISNQTLAYTSEMTNSAPPAATESGSSTPQAGSSAQASVASAPTQDSGPTKPLKKTASQKKGFNVFGLFDIIGRLEAFVKGKNKQNENVIDEAAQGNFEKTHRRAIATDPAARKVQEKLDKAQAERFEKFHKAVEE